VTGVSVDLNDMMKSKSEIVEGLTRGVEGLFKKYGVSGCGECGEYCA